MICFIRLRYAIWMTRISRTILFFDSYGMLPNNTYIIEFIRKNGRQTFWNRQRLQSFYSYCCGEYACLFAHAMANGNALRCFMSQFTDKYHLNDEKVRSLFGCLFLGRRRNQNCTSFFNCIQKT